MTSKRFLTSLIGPTTLIAASLMACVAETGDGGEEPTDSMRTAMVDFGNGPIEIQFEDRNGEAVFEGDIILGKTEEVRSGVLNMFWPSGPKAPKGAEDLEPQEDPAEVAAQEARNALESPEPPEDPDALDEFEVLERLDAPKAPERLPHAALWGGWLWSGGRIPYEIDSSLSQQVQDRIDEAINSWNESTIVRLVRRQSGDSSHFVRFTGPDADTASGGGSSQIGFKDNIFSDEPQLIRLGAGASVATVRHEIGHTVGLFHEQSRTDRDDHIRINKDNIQLDKRDNFYKYTTTGEPGFDYKAYDFESRMHYSSFAFAIDPSIPTIIRKKENCSFNTTDEDCLIKPSANLTSSDRKGVTRLVSGDPLVKFRLRNEETNKCLRPASGTTAANARVILSSCDNTASRRWYEYTRGGTTVPMIINEHSRLCLSRDTNNNLIQAHCRGTALQRYKTVDAFWDAPFGGDVLRSDGRCLTRVAGETQPRMTTNCETNSSNRRWFKDLL